MTDTFGARLYESTSVEGFLAAEGAAGERFQPLEAAATAILRAAFAGHAPLQCSRDATMSFSTAITASTVDLLTATFTLATQQSHGAWWLPEKATIKAGYVNMPSYYASPHGWAMTRCADDHGTYNLVSSPAALATWALLAPLCEELLEPLILRGPANGTLSPTDLQTRWSEISDRYAILGLPTDAVSDALTQMRPGQGWSTLDAAGQQAAKQTLITALGEAISIETVRRWRATALTSLINRYYLKAKKAPPEARAVLVKAVQPTLAAFHASDWLDFLDYLGESPAQGESIITVLPEARLYVEASAKVEQVAAEQGLPVSEVSKMLASYLGTDAVTSPVQRRVDTLLKYWQAHDHALASQAPGMGAPRSLTESQVPDPGGPDKPFAAAPAARWIPPELDNDITTLWGAVLIPSKPDRLVSALSPYWELGHATGPAFAFWWEINLTCWYICEGPSARTDLPRIKNSLRPWLDPLEAAGTPIDDALFADLTAAESKLGKPVDIVNELGNSDIGHGITLTWSMGSGQRRDGFEILRDILTRHRRAWAQQHLDTALRVSWETPLRDFAEDLNRTLAARGKPPTNRQLASMASKVANAWFGGNLTAAMAAIGETTSIEQADMRLLPHDRYAFARNVYAAIGGRTVPQGHSDYYNQYGQLSLAANATRLVQKQELIDHPPDAKEGGYGTYQNWPPDLDYDRYLAAIQSVLNSSSSEEAHTAATTPAVHSQPNESPLLAAAAATAIAKGSVAAGWYPIPGRAEVLRWWDGQEWTTHTAPGAGAEAGWFTDPQISGSLRWWDGAAWTSYTAPGGPVIAASL